MAEQQKVGDISLTGDEETLTSEDTGELSLIDVFDDSKEDAEPEKEEAETKDEKGEVEAKAEPDKAEEKADEAKSKAVETPSTESIGLQAALVAERQKRHAVEEKLKSLEVPEKIPDPIEDPEGYSAHVKAESSKGLLDTRISLSRDLMMDSKEDYLDKEKIFMELVGSGDDGKFVINDELLFKKFQDSNNPARFAYNYVIDHLLAEKYKDPDFEKNLEARLTEKILAGLKKEGSKETGLKATEVPDLTKATASGSNTEPVEREVTEVNQLFPETDAL